MAPDYAFRPMSAGDLSLVQRWLETPEVVRWWGRPDEQYALVSGDLDHPDMSQFIVAIGEHPDTSSATRSAAGIRALVRSRQRRAASTSSSASRR